MHNWSAGFQILAPQLISKTVSDHIRMKAIFFAISNGLHLASEDIKLLHISLHNQHLT